MSTSRDLPVLPSDDACTLFLQELGVAIDLRDERETPSESVELEYVCGQRLGRRPA